MLKSRDRSRSRDVSRPIFDGLGLGLEGSGLGLGLGLGASGLGLGLSLEGSGLVNITASTAALVIMTAHPVHLTDDTALTGC